MKRYFAIPFFIFFASCAAITKHGPVKTEQRTVAAFTRIHASRAIDIDFTPAASCSVTVEAPDDLLPKITTECSSGTLNISLDGSCSNINEPLKVHLQGPSLEAADLSGACSFELKSPLNGTDFHLDLEGASSFNGTLYMKSINASLTGASEADLEGMTNNLTVDLSGASSLSAEKLSSVVSVVKAEGASEAGVRADSAIDAQASGASSISYKGKPVSIRKESSGASSIEND